MSVEDIKNDLTELIDLLVDIQLNIDPIIARLTYVSHRLDVVESTELNSIRDFVSGALSIQQGSKTDLVEARVRLVEYREKL